MVSLVSYQLKIDKMTPTEFKARVAQAKDLDFGTIFNQSIELFKKSWVHGFLMQLFGVLLTLPLVAILYAPFIVMIISQSESGRVDTDEMNAFFAGFSVLYTIFFILGALLILAIQVLLSAGFFRVLGALDKGLVVRTSDLFYFMKGKYLGKIILLMLVILLISVPAVALCFLPFIYVMVPIAFFTMVFAFHPEWSVGDIVSSSFRLGNKKWLLTFGLLVVVYALLAIVTPFTCGLASLFLTPFMYHPVYYIYKGVIGFDDLDELDNIGKIEIL